MAFNLADVLAGVPNLGTGREQIEYIGIDQIVPDPENFYDLSGLDGLAENISLLGLQQPLRVRPMSDGDGKMMIISGHRRHAALKMLIEQDGRDDLRDVPCIVDRAAEENPKLTQLKLIYANAHTRVLTSAEISKQAEQVEKLLYELKEDGMEFPGRMRDHVAQAVGTSKSKLARLKVIRDGLEKCFVPFYEDNVLSEFAAYELARISGYLQQIIFDVYTEKDRKFGWLSGDEVKIFAARAEEISKITCPIGGGACQNCRKKLEKSVLASRYSPCPCTNCCDTCYDLASCKNACSMLDDKIKQIKDDRRDARKQEKAAVEESERPQRELLECAYARVKQLRANRSVSDADYVSASFGHPLYSEQKRLAEIDSGRKIKLTDRMPGGIWAAEAIRLIATADLLGCSVDYLLGRTDSVTTDPAPKPAPENVPKCGTWQTGDPSEPGEYVCLVRYDDLGSLVPEPCDWEDGRWFMHGIPMADSGVILDFWSPYPTKSTAPQNQLWSTPQPIQFCITGMSGSGLCGHAAYCPEPCTCCLQCDKDCSLRCGWIDAEEQK